MLPRDRRPLVQRSFWRRALPSLAVQFRCFEAVPRVIEFDFDNHPITNWLDQTLIRLLVAAVRKAVNTRNTEQVRRWTERSHLPIDAPTEAIRSGDAILLQPHSIPNSEFETITHRDLKQSLQLPLWWRRWWGVRRECPEWWAKHDQSWCWAVHHTKTIARQWIRISGSVDHGISGSADLTVPTNQPRKTAALGVVLCYTFTRSECSSFIRAAICSFFASIVRIALGFSIARFYTHHHTTTPQTNPFTLDS